MNNNKDNPEENIKKYELDFVHDQDLLPVLEKLGLKDEFLAGNIKCTFCNQVITNDNLYSFFEDNRVKVSCNKKTCIKEIEKKQAL